MKRKRLAEWNKYRDHFSQAFGEDLKKKPHVIISKQRKGVY